MPRHTHSADRTNLCLVVFFVLLGFQLLGEIVAYLACGLIPGPVLGMALIAIAMTVLRRLGLFPRGREAVASVSAMILGNLGILFVPAGVGIVQHADLIRSQGVAMLAVVSVSTAVTLLVTVWSFVLTKRLLGSRRDR